VGFYKFAIACTEQECSPQQPQCTLKLGKNPFPKALTEYKKALKTTAGDNEKALSETLMQALSGDQHARKFLETSKPLLDGHVSEMFSEAKDNLATAKEVGCIK